MVFVYFSYESRNEVMKLSRRSREGGGLTKGGALHDLLTLLTRISYLPCLESLHVSGEHGEDALLDLLTRATFLDENR